MLDHETIELSDNIKFDITWNMVVEPNFMVVVI